ncbi:MAG: CDP-paratose 2-epimerase, partial [Sphingobacteriaceae bacterium]
SGTGKQVRDVLFASDLLSCYSKAVNSIDITAGNAYNIGGGLQNSLSLIELFNILENTLSIKMDYVRLPVRQSDQKVFIADITKASNHFDWTPSVSKKEGLEKMISWMSE